MRLSKTIVFLLLAAAALIAVKFLFLSKNDAVSGRDAGAQGPPFVTAVVAKTEPLAQVLHATGSVLANEEVELRPEASGKITQLLFKEGTRVNKGDLLVKINNADLLAQLKRTELDIKLAEERVSRNEKLLEMKGISREEYDVLVNSVQSLRAEREVILAQIEKTEIRAPFSGMVGLKTVSEGSYVSPQTPIASMQQTDPVKIDFSVPEKYASLLAKGDEIEFTVGNSEKSFTGSIYAIEPRVDAVTRTVQVRGLCANTQGLLLPGSFAKISLVLGRQPHAIMLPTECIVPVLKGKQVYVYKDGKAEVVNVETGIRNDSAIHVVSGLNENDTVISTGLMQLRPGMEVKVSVK